MLEVTIQRFIRKVVEITNAHLADASDEAMLSREWENAFSDFDGWTVLRMTTYGRGGYWLYPKLIPQHQVTERLGKLPDFNLMPASAAYGHVMSGEDHWLDPYWDARAGFENSEIQMLFYRRYEARKQMEEEYVEFNQLVTHPLELHWSENRQAFCRINEYGEESEKIKLITSDGVHLILMRRKTLDKLLHLGKWALIRYTGFSRWRSESPPFGENKREIYTLPAPAQGKFRILTCGKGKIEYVEFRGARIDLPTTPAEELLSMSFRDEEESEKKYANFIVEDWKNKRILESYSLDPENFANYFTESDLPFEISPIYFNAEVLDKYKNNPDKYKLDDRSIQCRGGWYLETYDINAHNQVHTYAIYLSRLPYREQLHWAQYNEIPKGPISKRAFQTDFEAKFPDEAPLIDQLKDELTRLSEIRYTTEVGPIWSPKGGSWNSAARGLHLVNTENENQWHDFILALTNTTNEGLQPKTLKKIAKIVGASEVTSDGKPLGSLGLIKSILEKTGFKEKLSSTHAVLNELQERRGTGKAHGNWKRPEGSLIEDATKRLSAVLNAVRELAEIFEGLEI